MGGNLEHGVRKMEAHARERRGGELGSEEGIHPPFNLQCLRRDEPSR